MVVVIQINNVMKLILNNRAFIKTPHQILLIDADYANRRYENNIVNRLANHQISTMGDLVAECKSYVKLVPTEVSSHPEISEHFSF